VVEQRERREGEGGRKGGREGDVALAALTTARKGLQRWLSKIKGRAGREGGRGGGKEGGVSDNSTTRTAAVVKQGEWREGGREGGRE